MNQKASAGPSMVFTHHGPVTPGALIHDKAGTTCSFLTIECISDYVHESFSKEEGKTYQVAVARFPSTGAQTFWPWIIVLPHFLKTVPPIEPWHAWPPRAASSVMHLAASAVWSYIRQRCHESQTHQKITYIASLPSVVVVVSTAHSTFLENVGGDIRLRLQRRRCSCCTRCDC
jgi:hypothetical protein